MVFDISHAIHPVHSDTIVHHAPTHDGHPAINYHAPTHDGHPAINYHAPTHGQHGINPHAPIHEQHGINIHGHHGFNDYPPVHRPPFPYDASNNAHVTSFSNNLFSTNNSHNLGGCHGSVQAQGGSAGHVETGSISCSNRNGTIGVDISATHSGNWHQSGGTQYGVGVRF